MRQADHADLDPSTGQVVDVGPRDGGSRKGSADETLLVTGAEAAKLLGISRSSFYRLDATGHVPRPIRLGRMRRWSRAELCLWTERGCPSRERWEAKP